MCGAEDSFTRLWRLIVMRTRLYAGFRLHNISPTSQSQAFRGKMGVKGNFSHIVYHKGWQLTLLNVLTKSLSEFFYFALYEKHSSCINMEPNIPIIIGFKAQTE